MNNRHTIIHVILLASLQVSINAWAVDINGSVYGGGNLAGVNGNATVTQTAGTVSTGIYGGCNSQGTVGGAIAVNINGGTVGTNSSRANVHGGGYGPDTRTNGDITVTIGNTDLSTTPVIWGDVYGGSALGNVNDATTDITKVWLKKGTVNGSLYGGGLGDNSHAALVNGSVQVVVDGGTVTDSVFGANNLNGTPLGTITVTINNTNAPAQGSSYAIKAVYGGGNLAAYSPTATTTPATVIVNNCSNTIQDLFGGGNAASVPATDVTIHGGTFDRIFAGGNGQKSAANVTGNTSAFIGGGTIGQVFGGSNKEGTIGGTINVEINKETDGCLMQITEVYGGGNEAASNAGNLNIVRTGGDNEYIQYVYGGANDADVTGDITLNITGGRITGALFGGNNTGHTVTGDITLNIDWDNATGANDKKYLNNVFGGGNSANVTGNTSIKLLNGTVSNNIYGGGSQADVTGNTSIDLENGTVTNDVYGGGMQGDVGGNVTVNVSKANNTGTVTVGHDVYGGGALANTNTANRSKTIVEGVEVEQINLDPLEDSKKTIVSLYPGATISGDVYGGGRGQKDGNGLSAKPAYVYGDVSVYQLGAVLIYDNQEEPTSGRIFGCNNLNGTPFGHVLVYVSKTTGYGTTQVRSSNADRQSATAAHTYEMAAVYGGGNQAEYVPYSATETAEVHIDGCNDVSIHTVYGGGNAAATPATLVTVSGAYEIEFVYGGGNGAGFINGLPNPGANVGYHDYSTTQYTGTTQADIQGRSDKIYGTGKATTAIYGGRIHQIYGGSNTLGNIRETAVSMLDELSSCPLNLDGIYGGGREAYMEGKTTLELGCISGMEEIYGGSEKADVGGSVELTITSGHFGKVFGGNNKGGRIYGSITVNIEQTGCLPITIDELYLGGNNAPYSVYGYYKDGEAADAYTVVDFGTEQNPELVKHYKLKTSADNDRLFDQPVLNIRSFKSIGTVFGGGNGSWATMVGDPTVDINVTQGWINGEYNGENTHTYDGVTYDYSSYKGIPSILSTDGVINTVYGGGNQAKVIGQTHVHIGDKLGTDVTLQSMDELYESLDANGLQTRGIKIVKSQVEGVKKITYTKLDQNNQETSNTITVDVDQNVKGATITGNVYGGGNEAEVTVGTDVQIGRDPNYNATPAIPTPTPQRNVQTQHQNVSIEPVPGRVVTPTRQ